MKGVEEFLARGKETSNPRSPRGQEGDHQVPEKVPSMQEVGHEERQTQHAMWLSEKVTSLEREKEEMKALIKEMEVKIALQENTLNQVVERQVVVETAIKQIADHIQRQDVFNESARTSINGLVEEVKKHQERFSGMGSILQIHEQHITANGAVSQEMAQYVNALIQDNEKRMWVESLMRESQAQAEVLRQHQMGQQAIAGVLKLFVNRQRQQQQPEHPATMTEPSVTIVDMDDGTVQGFQGGPNPNTGPPDIASLSMDIVPHQLPNNSRVAGQF